MEKKQTIEKKPSLLELEKGTYFWCQCGFSKQQPFCDGSHKGGDVGPIKFQIDEEQKKVALCQCKATASSPFCDGSHKNL